MDPFVNAQLKLLTDKILIYGKEDLDDILHALAKAVHLVTGRNTIRIYLEDLTRGALSCAMATGRQAERIRARFFPINNTEFPVSLVYHTHEELHMPDMSAADNITVRELGDLFDIRATFHLPLMHHGRAVGVLAVDSSRPGAVLNDAQARQLRGFLDGAVAAAIDQARLYHQQLALSRWVDEAKKKEAALCMVKSAVKLIDKLALAAVLVPTPLGPDSSEECLQILASYADVLEDKRAYENQPMVNLGPGTSLLSRYISSAGVIVDETLLEPLYFPTLSSEMLQKRYLTEQLGLKSLYVVPRYDARTRRVICLVNYYTRGAHRFSDFEKGLLEAHAEMAQRVIQEIGDEHVEIKVLSEINDLLHEKFQGLPSFLNRVLSKATELIGADTGSIALVRKDQSQRWLVVEDPDGKLIGAKSKQRLKKYIPPLRIGSTDLPPEQRSLTGYVAHSGRPYMVADTMEEKHAGGFYHEVTNIIKSELGVPVVCDDEVIAVICMDSLRPYYFTDEHKRILQIISRMIARHVSDLLYIEKLTGEVSRLGGDYGYRDPNVSSYKLGNIIGNSAKASDIVEFIQKVTPPLFNRITMWFNSEVQEATLGLPSILITGDTGSGKEFLFNNIYSRLNQMYQQNIGGKNELPVKKTNIAAYSGELTYSELFGHKRGAFTGAHADRRGILEEAHGGLVFLDEIGDADPKTQVQLLRFLDNGGFVRLGENHTRYARVLLVAATNKDLGQLIREGRFREDLYHRLSELSVEVPSLNERREDIPDLALHFLGKLHQVYKKTDESEQETPALSRAAQQLLARHHFVGNIRELRTILVRALFFRKGRNIEEADIARVLASLGRHVDEPAARKLTSQVAQDVFDRIKSGKEDFWTGLHGPFTEKRISRDVVTEVVELAKKQGAASMPQIAEMLGACEHANGEGDDRRLFYKFKNFLYKTIKIA
ncbi:MULTISPECIES: GPMC system transcriptional regulator [Syntrophotalea]|jgi:transcriptional regulator with GAF, ATPase, and Fis domain|uniref:Fis family transcriptional regulator n=1 Tax=Syntrophotalea acetylenica TaxID=29542 RepID=A0A1L3GF35_SYNAC|nr:GPMC system transcriptional regulator [Syntrophotalea acetylenica]APG24547.1 Fis family transcriptional regulator [Syntrophotalea acetylenica]APG45133.1 Fis family transcriptional regulator [Syntrophotalea acetylenica]MDY0262775.1 GPMC system transcriptional regulator [Syntrophotalea acetylenica]